ncbi:DNA-binding protein HU-beta [Anaeroplasma bactoclasticum]|jgi:DNA-binding protein HU-beta|uniref:DNA-binding protein HU-beta n=1 Tax=Anaeroplasma bactoclasticum TaxID=2088 RepID=A0A397S6V9_9MOLU|nr:HU family DNA-binding protein [Anaeroplasma bactoclasticum]RIA78004.1 DNA-binding protein HU-beta [Anaeroplasma bactoclasticum]
MNKSEIVAAIADGLEVTRKDAERAVDTVFKMIGEALADGDKVVISGFGTFEVRTRVAREGRNPRTGEIVEVPAQKTPAFKAGKVLKDAVNK